MVWLINASQLEKLRKSPKNTIILDATSFVHGEERDAYAEYQESHIAGARFLNLNAFHDTSSPLPNMLIRDEQKIAELLGSLGITNEHKIIFYDRSEAHTSCRALWMFKVFGHHPGLLHILDGGFSAWEKFGGKIETGEAKLNPPKSYTVNFQAHLVRSLVQMKTNLHHPEEQVVDARHPVRYAGGKEPRLGMRSGHIPGSFCFPYFTIFESDGRLKPIERIRKQFLGTGIDLNYPIITTCGSGMTAAVVSFLLDLLNHEHHSLYDGGWAEWGAETLYPGETDLSERPVVTSLETSS